jgi:dTDP-4-dehydrorhamnose reductase
MKILLTGASGQVGWELARSLHPLGEVFALGRAEADLGNPLLVQEQIERIKPDVIVNPAAYTAVDKAESESELAHRINADAPGAMAEAAKKIDALLVHYSTDYVFDGSKTSPYDEADATKPLSVYGASKLAGEDAIQGVGGDYLILRTSWVYASRGSNFVKTMLRLAAEREELRVVSDQHGAPTWARLIAEATAHVVWQSVLEKQQGQFHSEIYHLTNSGTTTWHGFASRIIELVREQGSQPLITRQIHPIATTDYPLSAKRPANSLLSTNKLEQKFGLIMPTWENSLRLCLQELV